MSTNSLSLEHVTSALNVAIVTVSYPPCRNGTSHVCYNHAQQLTRLGHTVHIYTSSDKRTHTEVVAGVHIHRLRPLMRIGNGMILPQLLWKLRHFDVIHWHYPFIGGEMVALVAKLSRTPLMSSS